MNQSNHAIDVSRMIVLIKQVTSHSPYRGEISESTRYVEDINMESINRVMLMTLVEQEFGVNLENHMQALVDVKTVGDTVVFVNTLEGKS